MSDTPNNSSNDTVECPHLFVHCTSFSLSHHLPYAVTHTHTHTVTVRTTGTTSKWTGRTRG